MEELIHYSIPELQNLKKEIDFKLSSVQIAKGLLKASAATLEGIMDGTGDPINGWKFAVPHALVKNIKGVTIILPNEQSSNYNVKWKDFVLRTIKKQDMPM